MLNWCSDPSKLIEREDSKRSCPGCNHNMFERTKTGYKRWYCELGFNQRDGTALRSHCLTLRGN